MTVRAHCLPLSKIHSFLSCCDKQEKSSPEIDSQNGWRGREMTIPVRFRLFASRSCMIGCLANHQWNRVTLNRAWENFTHLELAYIWEIHRFIASPVRSCIITYLSNLTYIPYLLWFISRGKGENKAPNRFQKNHLLGNFFSLNSICWGQVYNLDNHIINFLKWILLKMPVLFKIIFLKKS